MWNAQTYHKYAGFVPELGKPVIQLLDLRPDEEILDLGCGDGTLTKELIRMCRKVVGIDESREMVDAAKRKGVDARVMNGEAIDFDEKFDAVFSNAALHWMLRPEKVIAGVGQALRDGGRFVGEFGGYGNVKSIMKAMRIVFYDHPEFGTFKRAWYFPSAAEYSALLQKHDFDVVSMELIPRPTPIGDIADGLEVFAGGILSELNGSQKDVFIHEVRQILRPVLYSDDSGWLADYVRLRFKAVYHPENKKADQA